MAIDRRFSLLADEGNSGESNMANELDYDSDSGSDYFHDMPTSANRIGTEELSFRGVLASVSVKPLNVSKEMQAVMKDVHYWISLVSTLGYDSSIYQPDTIPSLDILSRYFDSSDRGLLRVFDLFDSDHDSLLSFDQISSGLKQQALYINSDDSANIAFEDLCVLIGAAGTREVRPPEFLWALKNLRLAALLHGNFPASEYQMHLYDYKAERLAFQSPIQDPRAFLFESSVSPVEGCQVRWLHCHDGNPRSILAIAVKYGLDPRFVLDILTLWREQAKVDKLSLATSAVSDQEAHILFAVVPVLRLSARSADSLAKFAKLRRGKRASSGNFIVEIEHCNLSLIATDRKLKNSILTFSSEWGLLSKLITEPLDKRVEVPYKAPAAFEDLDVFRKIMITLNTTYSVLRTGDSDTFLLRALCEISEDYRKIAEAYDAGIHILQKRLEREKDSLSQDDVRKMRKSIRQLSHLYRLVRPMLNVASILSGMTWGEDAPLYCSEIQTNTSGFLDSVLSCRAICRQMLDDFESFRERRITNIVYSLTVVFAICAPAQFISSVYGMNFKHEGQASMPELLWPLGYAFYWGVALALTCLVAIFIYYRRRTGWM